MVQIISFFALIFSIIPHEVAHGYIALRFGDDTALRQGRLTLNPAPHIDLMGSILLPGLLILSGAGFVIGWAKPVPVNPSRMRLPLKNMVWVSLAGPLTNISIAVVASILFRLLRPAQLFAGSIFEPVWAVVLLFLFFSIQINLVLAIFNLIPIPPLDGSRVLVYFLPNEWKLKFLRLEPYGFAIIFALAYFGLLSPLIRILVEPLFNLLL